jgi:hypothetical protein
LLRFQPFGSTYINMTPRSLARERQAWSQASDIMARAAPGDIMLSLHFAGGSDKENLLLCVWRVIGHLCCLQTTLPSEPPLASPPPLESTLHVPGIARALFRRICFAPSRKTGGAAHTGHSDTFLDVTTAGAAAFWTNRRQSGRWIFRIQEVLPASNLLGSWQRSYG